MTVDEWRLHDVLTVRFSKILHAFEFPEALSFNTTATATGEAVLQNQVRDYFHRDPLAQHALRALVHAAVEEIAQIK